MYTKHKSGKKRAEITLANIFFFKKGQKNILTIGLSSLWMVKSHHLASLEDHCSLSKCHTYHCETPFQLSVFQPQNNKLPDTMIKIDSLFMWYFLEKAAKKQSWRFACFLLHCICVTKKTTGECFKIELVTFAF